MKWEISYKEKFPAWRSSDGQLREKKGETDEPVTGYIPSERERRLDTGPKKIMDFANSYGALSAGFDEKKQLVLVTSQQHTKELSGLPPESKAVDAETAKKVSPITGDFYVNQDKERKEDSAVAYRVDAGKGPSYVMSRLKELMEDKDFMVQDEITPFLSVREEKKELEYLRKQAVILAGGKSREEKLALDKRVQFLTTVVADKERQKQIVATRLLSLLQEAGKDRTKDWDPNLPWSQKDMAEAEDGEKGENVGDNEGEEEDRSKGKSEGSDHEDLKQNE